MNKRLDHPVMTRDEALAMDAKDPLYRFRDAFHLPKDIIYLDGNSLGPLPRTTATVMTGVVRHDWGDRLIRSWNEGWIDAPERIGAKIAGLIGADADEVIIADSTSVNLFKLLVAALRLSGERCEIVGEAGNFPTDLHVAEGAAQCVSGARLHVVPRGRVECAIGNQTAVTLLTHVHYQTGERFNLTEMTALAHDRGRYDPLGSESFGRCGAARFTRSGRRHGGRLYLQISERWSRRASLSLCL